MGATKAIRLLTYSCCLVVLLSANLWAQVQGAILQGQLLDPSGAAIPNAMVQWSAVGVAGGETGNSDANGQFSFEIPLARGSVQVQVSVTANRYLPTQATVSAQSGQITPLQIVLNPKPPAQLAIVSGTLKDTKTHAPIPSAEISILGAGGVLATTTDVKGKFKFKGVGFNANLTIRAETLEVPCVPTTDYPLSVGAFRLTVPLTAQTLFVHTPHCPNNAGISHRTADQQTPLPIGIDDTLQWKQADLLAIQTNPNTNAWNAGHVNDILRGPAGTGLIAASDEGGVWLIAENAGKTAIPVGNTWPSITMTSLAYGPGGSSDVYAGTWDESPESPGGVLWETDTSTGFPLLNWLPVSPQPPCHSIERILVITEVQRVIVACNSGLWWSAIPPSPSVHGAYNWQGAYLGGNLVSKYFSGLAKGTGWIAGTKQEGVIVASVWGGKAPSQAIYTGKVSGGFLNLKATSVASPVSPLIGRTSLTSCPKNQTFMWAVGADGSDVGMAAIWESTSGGTTWNLVNLPPNPGQQGGYNNVIAVSGDCSILAVGWQGGTFLSFDSGTSWSPITDAPGYNHIHADVHALTFDPADPTTLFIGSDGGVVEASGLAPNVQPVLESDWSQELLNLEFNPGAASTSFGGLVAGAAQDNGVLYSDLPGIPWQHVTDCHCDGGQALFATPPGTTPGDDLLIEREWGEPNFPLDWVESVNGVIPFGKQKDIHVASSETETVNREVAQAVRNPGGFVNAAGEPMIAVDGGFSNLYGLFSQADGSDIHWEPIGQIGGGDNISAVAPSITGDAVFVGTDAGNLYLFKAPYTAPALQLSVNSPETGPASVSGLYAFFNSLAWASYNVNNHGYVMFFNGLTWDASGTTTLPHDLPFKSISARDLNTIFTASSAAVYDTRNAGTGWSRANIGLPANVTHNPQLYYLPASPSGSAYLYLSTWGRSLWRTLVP